MDFLTLSHVHYAFLLNTIITFITTKLIFLVKILQTKVKYVGVKVGI